MDNRLCKKIICPLCEGRGRVFGWDCKRCGTAGEVSIPVEEVEKEELFLAERKTYWDRISDMNERQVRKGVSKYGDILENNTTMPTDQRIEHIEEEMIDALNYLEHLKVVLFADGMTANDYQRAALRTASGMNYEDHGMLMNGILGLCGETGEVADLVKKATFQGHELDKEKLCEELGDVAWYLAVASHAAGFTLDQVLQGNVEKLKKRYPNGFSKERSVNRDA